MRTRSHRGFSLLEVLLALAVLSIALAAVVQTVGRHAVNAQHLQQRTLAHWVAANQVARMQLGRPWPHLGRHNGQARQGGDDWGWSAQVQRTESPVIRRIEIQVSPADDTNAVAARLTAFVRRPQGDAAP